MGTLQRKEHIHKWSDLNIVPPLGHDEQLLILAPSSVLRPLLELENWTGSNDLLASFENMLVLKNTGVNSKYTTSSK